VFSSINTGPSGAARFARGRGVNRAAASQDCNAHLIARRRGPGVFLVIACFATLTGCDGPTAPSTRGVCWRADAVGQGGLRFDAIARHVESLDDCAAELEALHLQGEARLEGAFQGYFIFIDAAEVTSAPSADGFRYPIFQPTQRRAIDAELQAMIRERNGKPPSAADFSVERH